MFASRQANLALLSAQLQESFGLWVKVGVGREIHGIHSWDNAKNKAMEMGPLFPNRCYICIIHLSYMHTLFYICPDPLIWGFSSPEFANH